MSEKPLRILHFADAHIDIANYGRLDPETALPMRIMDFLRALDQIIDTAIDEKVDLVLFAGDAYKDRNPQPTFQREWGKRMKRLSQAGIPTLLLIGNHDISPASGRAHTLQEFATLGVPHIHVADRISLWDTDKLAIPAQIITVPWVSRNKLMTREETSSMSLQDVLTAINNRVTQAVINHINDADPALPLILTAHASVEGATFSSEKGVMLGHELVLGGQIVSDPRLDYVALGHIHKHQALNARDSHPPIVYPGSIERIDFGEAQERKGFVMAEISRGNTTWEFVPLQTRRFLDISVDTPEAGTFMQDIMGQLPEKDQVQDAVCRLKLSYPVDWEPLLDEKQLLVHFDQAFSLQIQKRRESEKRARLGDTVAVEALSPMDLLETYWWSTGLESKEIEAMRALAKEVLATSKA